jgi:hypothetical protein
MASPAKLSGNSPLSIFGNSDISEVIMCGVLTFASVGDGVTWILAIVSGVGL